MRLLLALLSATLVLAALSGCTSTSPAATLPDEPTAAGFQDSLFEGDPTAGEPTGKTSGHGEPERDDGTVETGMTPPLQLPGLFWARRTVTIGNDFGGASNGVVFVGGDMGTISIEAGDGDDYAIEATLEASGMTEQDARDALDRMELTHTDVLEDDGLHLTTVIKQKDPQSPIPLVVLSSGTYGWADIKVTLPGSAAYELSADTSFGDVSVSGLRGPSVQLTASSGGLSIERLNVGDLTADTSSGDIDLETVQARTMEASASSGSITGAEMRVGKASFDTSSGDIDLEGAFDTLEADASSGSLTLETYAVSSGAYKLSTSSGNIDLGLLTGDGRAYRVDAESSSGTIQVDLPDSDTIDDEDDHAEVVSEGFDQSPLQTVIEIDASSGDIAVEGHAVHGHAGDEGDEEADATN